MIRESPADHQVTKNLFGGSSNGSKKWFGRGRTEMGSNVGLVGTAISGSRRSLSRTSDNRFLRV